MAVALPRVGTLYVVSVLVGSGFMLYHICINQATALRLHGDGEHVPHLRMLDEQIGVEEQRKLVTVQRDVSEALPQPGNIQRSRLS